MPLGGGGVSLIAARNFSFMYIFFLLPLKISNTPRLALRNEVSTFDHLVLLKRYDSARPSIQHQPAGYSRLF